MLAAVAALAGCSPAPPGTAPATNPGQSPIPVTTSAPAAAAEPSPGPPVEPTSAPPTRPSATLPPTATPSPAVTPTATEPPGIELLFTGDINPGRCVYAHALAAGDLALPFRALADVLAAADITVGSLDGSLSDVNPPAPCAEYHRNLMGPTAMVAGMQLAGYDVMSVATNHVRDCGLPRGCMYESLLDTLTTLQGAGITPAGAGKDLAAATAPVVISVQGVRFAFVAFTAINHGIWATAETPGPAPFEREVYLEAIRAARAHADVVIVLPHWGREYIAEINWQQFLAAEEMVAAGATLVVGNHPHRVQAVETFPSGAVVAYSLGNFVFDQEWSDGTQYTIQGLMLRARFRGAELQGVELLPIHIYDDMQPRLAGEAEAAVILQAVADSLAAAPRRNP